MKNDNEEFKKLESGHFSFFYVVFTFSFSVFHKNPLLDTRQLAGGRKTAIRRKANAADSMLT